MTTTSTASPELQDLDNLEALARAAKPGRWMRLFGERTVYDRMEDGCRGNAIVRADLGYGVQDISNLDFIAGANPEQVLALIALARRAQPESEAPQAESFQQRVQPWMTACFGAEISADKVERNDRFTEESLELGQACGMTKDRVLALVDYVYDRPLGEPAQEVGGVIVTLAALCLAQGLDMHDAAEVELARIWTKVEAIRAKQLTKPRGSPLPAPAASLSPLCGAQHAESGKEATDDTPRKLSEIWRKGDDFVIGPKPNGEGWEVYCLPGHAPFSSQCESERVKFEDWHYRHFGVAVHRAQANHGGKNPGLEYWSDHTNNSWAAWRAALAAQQAAAPGAKLMTYDEFFAEARRLGCKLPADVCAALAAAPDYSTPGTPIQMILHCPACGVQHIDAPDERTEAWDNPPHRSHLCHGCGHIWRPADVATKGVATIQTQGSKDSPAPATSAPGTPEAPKPPFPISDDEMAALRRFWECATDGEGYDIDNSMMQRLAEMGLVQRKSGAYYMSTDFGLYVLGEYTIQRAAQLDGGQGGSAP